MNQAMDVSAQGDESAGSRQTRGSRGLPATVCGAGITVVVCVLALIPTVRALGAGSTASMRLAWDASHGVFAVGLDSLGAFFLLPVLVLSALGAVYGGNYLLIGLALGVGLWGWASKMPAIAALGMAAGLFHVWNHALMKGLMFLAAGSVLHGTGTRDIEKLGGLMKRMPWTGTVMTVGAVAIAALPPLNGFVSKW